MHCANRYLTWSNKGFATFNFKSSCDREIYITDLIVYTADRKEMKRFNPLDGYIRAFGVKTFLMDIRDINLDLVKKASYLKKMEKPKNLKNFTNDNAFTVSDNTFTAIAWIIGLGFIAFVGYTWYEAENPIKKN